LTGAVLLRRGEGETVTERRERSVVIKAAHDLLDITETRYSPGEEGPSDHVHREHADVFFVLDGVLRFRLGPDRQPVDARTGTLVLVPRNVIHSFANESDADAHFLNMHAPSKGFAESLRVRRDGGEYVPERFDSFDPPTDGGRSVSDAVVRGPGEGDELAAGPSGALFKAEVTDGDGTLSLTETTIAPGFPGPLPHRHSRMVDSFYVLEGTLSVLVEGEEHEVAPGGYAFVPPGVAHTFSNPGEEAVRMLNIQAPGGLEQYLKELAAVLKPGEQPDPAVMAKLASRYDFAPA
jgi:mannose-6-phosphate isomerase-like protein (cupin superfamily)